MNIKDIEAILWIYTCVILKQFIVIDICQK